MKTITLKTQDDFFEQINQMAFDAHLSKSSFIRKTILDYQKKVKGGEMAKKMREDSLRS